MTLTIDTAMDRAEAEFAKFQILFLLEAAENPTLSYEELTDRVVYAHPVFEDEDDQALYDNAAYVVALGQIISAL